MTSPPPDTFITKLEDFGLLGFEGPDARGFLQGQFSNDVEALAPGRGQWTSYNSAKGRMFANLWLWQAPGWPGHERYDALLTADLAAATQKRLSMFVLRAKLRIVDRSAGHRFFGVMGPGAAHAIAAAFGRAPAAGEVADIEGMPARSVALPDGRFVVVAAADAAAVVGDALAPHALAADAEHWRALGVAAGIAWITAATTDQFVPQMINWDALAGVSFQKGCYPGQEVVARMRYLGRLKERMFLLHAETRPPAPGTRLFSPVFDGQPCGTVVSSAAAASGSDLLAVVQMSAVDVPGLTLASADGPPLVSRALPYPLPEIAAPRGRLA